MADAQFPTSTMAQPYWQAWIWPGKSLAAHFQEWMDEILLRTFETTLWIKLPDHSQVATGR